MLTVTKAGNGGGTVTSAPVGIACGADCTEEYTYGTAVTLTATPDTGSYFSSWSGDADCTDGVVTMDTAKGCTATVNVAEPSVLSDIIVTPDTVTVVVGGTQQFTATGYDQYGASMAISPVWDATGGSIDAGGQYTATVVGGYSVSATDGGVTGTATVTVTETPVLTSIEVTPATATLAVGWTQQFSAAGYDQYGAPIGINLVWDATGGSIDAGGQYTATVVGGYSVSATDGGVTGIAAVTVTNEGATIEKRVSAGSDDAEEYASGGMYLTSGDLEMTYDGSTQKVGMRFNGINIPQGAEIIKAYIQFRVDETSSVATSLTIEGEDVDNAVTFTGSPLNISTRERTAASVAWTPVPWTTGGAAGPDQRTSDISSVIEEIVNRGGWSNGNSLVIIMTGTGKRVAESYEGDSAGAPLLHVEYGSNGGDPGIQKIKVMPLGDSITKGTGSSDEAGYRRDLEFLLNDAGHDVDFVGSQQHGSNDFDREHEGHAGWEANQIRDNIYNWLVNYQTDIVLLHIGTNDISSGQSVSGIVTEVGQILDNVDQYESDYSTEITVFVALIVNRSNPFSTDGLSTTEYNNQILTMAQARIALGDNILLVDHESALTYPNDMADILHPNDSGYDKMAATWAAALNTFLSSP
jgi:lysophospholipase L1-like esterase